MSVPVQGPGSNDFVGRPRSSETSVNPKLSGMTRESVSSSTLGKVKKSLNDIANVFRRIATSVTQANSGAPISMTISVKNLGIASNPARSEPLSETGIKNLKDHVTNLTPEKKRALVDSAIRDVEDGGQNLLKLLNRNPDMFDTVVEFGRDDLLPVMDKHSAKIPTKLLSAVSDHMPKYIRDQCVTGGAQGALIVDFDKGVKKIAGLFQTGGMSLHQVLETVKSLISTDIDGAMEKTGKDDISEIFDGIRGLVGAEGGSELKDGLAINKYFQAMSRPGEIAGGVLDSLNSGSSLDDAQFRESVNQALTAAGISLKFTGDESNDTAVKKALKGISKKTGAGSGGDGKIFNQMTIAELKELKTMASSETGHQQVEARFNGYTDSTPEAANSIATACVEIFSVRAPIQTPNVTRADVNKLLKKLDRRFNIFGSFINAYQKRFSPEQYVARKIDKMAQAVSNIQKEVNADRLTWNQEARTLAIEMVSQKLEQYIDQLDRMSGSNAEFKSELMKQASVLLEKIDKVIVPAAQFERLTPMGDISLSDTSALESLQIGDEKYAIKELVGRGQFGQVYRCEDKNGVNGVVKVMVVSDMTVSTMDALQEVYTAQQFTGHRHIMAPSSVAITELDNNEIRFLALVMPEADHGDMENVVKRLADTPRDEQTPVLLKLLTDAADGLVEMHRKGYAHRDIKPGNIFVKTGSAGDLVGMLGDLGSAQNLSEFDG
ncbi:protein kinase family protein, partial [bacterium]|nr:protein kinase family protein [bacterium]